MFPHEIKQEILTKFVQDVPISKLIKAYHFKGSVTICHWNGRFKMFGIGGPHTIADKVASILSVMGTFNYVGKIGNGTKLKLITNDTIMAAEAGIRETLDLSDAYGIDYQTTLDLLQKGPLKPVVVRALDKTNPRPLADSLADVDELVGATKKLIDLPIVKSAQNRLKKAVNVKPQAEFIDITNKSTALKQFRDS